MAEPQTDPLGGMIAPPSILGAGAAPSLTGNPASLQPPARQPAAAAPVAAPASPGFDMSGFVDRNMQLEGTGPDPRSSAVSGFMPDTWVEQVRKNVPKSAGMSDEQVLSLRADPALRRQMWASLAIDNAGALKTAGAPVNAATLRMANWFGAGGAAKLLGTPDQTPVDQVFDAKVIEQNPALAGKTAGQVKEMVAAQMGAPGAFMGSDIVSRMAGDVQKLKSSEYEAAANLNKTVAEMTKGLASGKGDLADAMKRVRAAQEKADEAQTAATDALKRPPEQPEISGVNHLNGLATFVGIFGGLFTRQPMRNSLNAAASAIEAYNDGDREAYKTAYQNWSHQTDMLFKVAQMTQTRVHDILYNEQMGQNERNALLDVTLRAAGLTQLADKHKIDGDNAVVEWDKYMHTADQQYELKKATMEQAHELALLRLDLQKQPKNEAQAEEDWVNLRKTELEAANKANGINEPVDAKQLLELHHEYRKEIGKQTAGSGLDATKTVEVMDKDGKVVDRRAARESKAQAGWVDSTTGEPLKVPEGGKVMPTTAGAGSRQAGMLTRLTSAGNEAVAALQNLAELPISATSGWFMGVQNERPDSLGDALKRGLARKLTDTETKDLIVSFTGIQRALATLESAGAAQGLVGLSTQMSALMPQTGDPPVVILRKYAEIKQIIERSMETVKASGQIPDSQMKLLDKIDQEAKAAVPWSVHDVNVLERGMNNPNTVQAFAEKVHLSRKSADAGPPVAAIEALRAHPERRDEFDSKFPGWSAKILDR